MKTMKVILLITIGFLPSLLFSQEKQNNMTNQAVVKTFLEGFNDPSKIQASLALLAEDYKFQNPMVQLQSKAEFIALAQEIGKVVNGIDIIRIAENSNWVAVFYEFKSSVPGLERNAGTEWFKVENGMILESYLIYDASKWRKVYAAMEE